jgi:hypothetical protein
MYISKQQFGQRLYFLNRGIKETKAELQKKPNDEVLRQKVRELYSLKKKVLIKLLSEGHVKVSFARTDNGEFYTFSINRIFSFHLPKKTEIKEAVRKHGRKRTYASRN